MSLRSGGGPMIGQHLAEPRAQLVAEGLLFGGVAQIHGGTVSKI